MRKKLKKIASSLFAISIITTSMVTNTLARYLTGAMAADTIRYAKWAVYVDDFDLQKQRTFDVNLFDTIYDSNGVTPQTFNTETKVIAPGTMGKWEFTVKNLSEVDCTYSIKFNPRQKTAKDSSGKDIACDKTPSIEFKLDDNPWSSTIDWSDGTLESLENKTHTIKWRWLYVGNNDNDDTTLGHLMTNSVTDDFYVVNVSITFTQVD